MKAKKKKPAKPSAKNKKTLIKKVTKKLAKKKVVSVKKKIVPAKKKTVAVKKKKSIKKPTAPKAKSQNKVSAVQKQGNKKHIPKPRVKRKAQLVFKTESIKPTKPKPIVKLEAEEIISELPVVKEEIITEVSEKLKLDGQI